MTWQVDVYLLVKGIFFCVCLCVNFYDNYEWKKDKIDVRTFILKFATEQGILKSEYISLKIYFWTEPLKLNKRRHDGVVSIDLFWFSLCLFCAMEYISKQSKFLTISYEENLQTGG